MTCLPKLGGLRLGFKGGRMEKRGFLGRGTMDVVGDSSDSSSQMSGGDFMEINLWSLVKSSQDA